MQKKIRILAMLLTILSPLMQAEEGCFKRFLPDKCDAFRDVDFNTLKNQLSDIKGPEYDMVVGNERYDESTGKFLTDITFDFGAEYDITDFCDQVINTGLIQKDCLGINSQLNKIKVTPGDKITLQGDCARHEGEPPNGPSPKTDFQLADALRDFDRAIFYNNKMYVNATEKLVHQKIISELPLLTENQEFALKYANDSYIFLIYSSKLPVQCVKNWNIDVKPISNDAIGLWNVTLQFEIDQDCTGDEQSAVCQNEWQPRVPHEAWVCEGANCYERAPCLPPTCPVNHFGADCSLCPTGSFSLKPGAKAKKLTKCFDYANSSTACQQIVDLKLTPCSSKITPRMKRLLSLVLDVECNNDGSLQLTWGESKSKLLKNNQDVIDFVKTVFNVTDTEFTLQYVQRSIAVEESRRRHLLSQDEVIDNSVTLIQYTSTSIKMVSSTSSTNNMGVVIGISVPLGAVLILLLCYYVLPKCWETGKGVSKPPHIIYVYTPV